MGRSLARQRKLFREHFLLFIIEREGKAGLEGGAVRSQSIRGK